MALFNLNFNKKSDTYKKVDSLIKDHDFDNDIAVKALDQYASGEFVQGSIDEISITDTSLQRLFFDESWVFAPISAISDDIGSMPWGAVKLEEKEGQITTALAEDTSLNHLLQFPSPFSSDTEFKTLISIDLLTVGEAFIWNKKEVKGDRENEAASEMLLRLNPTLIDIEIDEKTGTVKSYIMSDSGGAFRFPAEDVIHIKKPNPGNPHKGMSPLIPSFKRILLDRFNLDHQIRFYKNGARVGGVVKASKMLTRQQIKTIQRSFENDYVGEKNQHKTLILPNGMDYQSIQATASESQMLEVIKFNRDAIISALKVPPIKLGFLEDASYANANVQEKLYFTNTIKPLLSLIESAFNLHRILLDPATDLRVQFDTTSITTLQSDMLEKAKTGKAMIEAGLTPDEVREMVWNKKPLSDEFEAAEKPKIVAEIENLEAQTEETEEAAELLEEDPGAVSETIELSANIDEIKDLPSGDMGRISSDVIDTKQTFEQRVAQLTAEMVDEGLQLELAIDAAIKRAIIEGYQLESQEAASTPQDIQAEPDDVEDKQVEKVERDPNETFDECISRAIPKLIEEGMSRDQAIAAAHTMCELPKAESDDEQTKDVFIEVRKDFIDKTDKWINERQIEVEKFLIEYKDIVVKKVSNVKHFIIPRKKADRQDVLNILDAEELEKLVEEFVSKNSNNNIAAAQSGFNGTLPDVAISFNLTDSFTEAMINDLQATSSKLYSKTINKNISNIIKDGFTNKKTIAEISADINNKFTQIAPASAERIARTEVLSAHSQGQDVKMEEISKEFPEQDIKLTWVSIIDDRTRTKDADHVRLNGESIIRGEGTFNDSLSKLRFPRDPHAKAGSVVQCRCTLVTEMKDKKN